MEAVVVEESLDHLLMFLGHFRLSCMEGVELEVAHFDLWKRENGHPILFLKDLVDLM